MSVRTLTIAAAIVLISGLVVGQAVAQTNPSAAPAAPSMAGPMPDRRWQVPHRQRRQRPLR